MKEARHSTLKFDILSLFPGYFRGPFDESIIARARKNELIEVQLTDIRDFSDPPHHSVDDRAYGGGPGMVMMAEPIARAIDKVRRPDSHVIYLSPQGKRLTADRCRKLANHKHLILLCGHYEGIDQRLLDAEVDEEICIGDYVLTNGCVAAIVLVDAVSRFIPGVLGDERAAGQDSFENGLLDCPHYTRPEEWRGRKVPEVLLSGHHQKIEQWRYSQAVAKTNAVRPEIRL